MNEMLVERIVLDHNHLTINKWVYKKQKYFYDTHIHTYIYIYIYIYIENIKG